MRCEARDDEEGGRIGRRKRVRPQATMHCLCAAWPRSASESHRVTDTPSGSLLLLSCIYNVLGKVLWPPTNNKSEGEEERCEGRQTSLQEVQSRKDKIKQSGQARRWSINEKRGGTRTHALRTRQGGFQTPRRDCYWCLLRFASRSSTRA